MDKTIKTLMIITALFLSLFLYGCKEETIVVDDSGTTQDGINSVVYANNKFAFNLYSQYESEEGNVFFSPYSVSSALAMTYEGAKGRTADEMYQVLNYRTCVCKQGPCNCPVTDRRSAFASIYNDINAPNNEYRLSTANALWVQKDYSLLKDYTDLIAQYYGGKATNLDFITETEKSRETINNYIEEQTNDKIKDLIPAGMLDSMTRLVLTNAIYFKGTWEWEFDKDDTRDQDFFITPENIVQTPMMHMNPEKAKFNYADIGKLQILELPYKGDKLSMLILLPKQGQEYDFETGEMINYENTLDDIELSIDKLNEYKAQMTETKLDSISLPKFEFNTKYFMKDTLIELGMGTAFNPLSADFLGMTGNKDLFIGSVIHQAFVGVDEEGTEAAAATAVIIKLTSAIPSNIFRADHPFIFLIQDKETGIILFIGRVNDPSE